MMEESGVLTRKNILISALVVVCLGVFYYQWKGYVSAPNRVSVLPCCTAVDFSTELNALHYMSLCLRLRQNQLQSGLSPSPPPDSSSSGSWFSQQLASWCVKQLHARCGLHLTEPAVEWHRRLGMNTSSEHGVSDGGVYAPGAGQELQHCLETRFSTRREHIRPLMLPSEEQDEASTDPSPGAAPAHRLPLETESQQLHTAGEAAASSRASEQLPEATLHAHQQAQRARAAPRTLDRLARPGPMPGPRPSPGGPGSMVQPQPKGSGPLSIIMPIYSVGIVIFFVYTVIKVVTRRNSASAERRVAGSYMTDGARFRPAPAGARPTAPPAVQLQKQQQQQNRPLQQSCCQPVTPVPPTETAAETARTPPATSDDNDDVEIEELRRRLEETEKAMEVIMSQLGNVSAKLTSAKQQQKPREEQSQDKKQSECGSEEGRNQQQQQKRGGEEQLSEEQGGTAGKHKENDAGDNHATTNGERENGASTEDDKQRSNDGRKMQSEETGELHQENDGQSDRLEETGELHQVNDGQSDRLEETAEPQLNSDSYSLPLFTCRDVTGQDRRESGDDCDSLPSISGHESGGSEEDCDSLPSVTGAELSDLADNGDMISWSVRSRTDSPSAVNPGDDRWRPLYNSHCAGNLQQCEETGYTGSRAGTVSAVREYQTRERAVDVSSEVSGLYTSAECVSTVWAGDTEDVADIPGVSPPTKAVVDPVYNESPLVDPHVSLDVNTAATSKGEVLEFSKSDMKTTAPSSFDVKTCSLGGFSAPIHEVESPGVKGFDGTAISGYPGGFHEVTPTVTCSELNNDLSSVVPASISIPRGGTGAQAIVTGACSNAGVNEAPPLEASWVTSVKEASVAPPIEASWVTSVKEASGAPPIEASWATSVKEASGSPLVKEGNGAPLEREASGVTSVKEASGVTSVEASGTPPGREASGSPLVKEGSGAPLEREASGVTSVKEASGVTSVEASGAPSVRAASGSPLVKEASGAPLERYASGVLSVREVSESPLVREGSGGPLEREASGVRPAGATVGTPSVVRAGESQDAAAAAGPPPCCASRGRYRRLRALSPRPGCVELCLDDCDSADGCVAGSAPCRPMFRVGSPCGQPRSVTLSLVSQSTASRQHSPRTQTRIQLQVCSTGVTSSAPPSTLHIGDKTPACAASEKKLQKQVVQDRDNTIPCSGDVTADHPHSVAPSGVENQSHLPDSTARQ